MKKIIILMFLFVGTAFGQAAWTKYDKQEGRFTKHAKGDSSAVNVYVLNASGDTLGVVSLIFSQAQIDSLQKVTWSALWASAANQVTTNAKLDSLDASSTRIEGYTNGIEANQTTQINYATPFTSSSGTLTTVSTEVDTTVFIATKWQTYGVFALNDSLEISLSGSFADAKLVLPYTEYTFNHFSPTTFPKGYIRRYGGAGTVSYIPTIKGY